jgi:tRNA-binding EMAP/Myf-like protein
VELALADFKKTELRVARVLEVSEIPGADKLWKRSSASRSSS